VNELLVVFVGAGEDYWEAYSCDELAQDASDDHRVLRRVLHAENVRQDHLAKLARLLPIEDQEGDHDFEELEDRPVQLFWCGLVFQQ